MAFSLALGVTPELLKSKSGEVSADIETMAAAIRVMDSEINGTGSYWRGDAGEQQRRKFNDHVAEINQLMERLRTYPTRILQMAGIYETAEENNVVVASSMTADLQMR